LDRLPIFLDLTSKDCLVVGGGVVAERKVRLLERTGANVTVLAPAVTENLQSLIDGGQITHIPQRYGSVFVKNFWLVVASTENDSLNRQIAADADNSRCFCNVVDDNEASTFILPAIVDRSPVVIAIGTEGNAPVLAQQLKNKIEAWLPERIGELAAQAGRWRGLVKKRFSTLRERRRFWQRFFTGSITEHLLAGRQSSAEHEMRAELIGDADAVGDSHGEAWIVGAGPGDPGLVTLRGQQLIGRADVVLYDRLVSKPVLDFARKEAEFVSVGKRAGARAMSQDEINALLVDLVRQGRRVCRLKGGDPFVFGRGGEEAQALADAGLPATAKLDNGVTPNWPQLLKSGDTLALYMGVGSIAEIATRLLENNVDPETPVAFVENGTTRQQRTFLCDVASMADVANSSNIQSPTVIYIGKSVRVAEDLQWFEGASRASEFSSVIDGESVAAASF
jgi:uroporphyrin-III C-methyltransferase/precorrin-2 dehydrogenase/sirohydrochlorin ferrochelatase